jgi:hypothetical protein
MVAPAVGVLQSGDGLYGLLMSWLDPLGIGVPPLGFTGPLGPARPTWDWYACCRVQSVTAFDGGDSPPPMTTVLLALLQAMSFASILHAS